MENKNIVMGVLAVVAVVLGAGYLKPTSVTNVVNVPEQQQVSERLGAFPGPEMYSYANIHGHFTHGGGTALSTSTTATTYTMVEKDLAQWSLIDLTINTGATTFTLPATSTMLRLLGNETGANREWLIHNATSTAVTLTLAAGAGMDLVAVTANDDVIDAGEWTRLTCNVIPYRTADNENIMCIVDELANAD